MAGSVVSRPSKDEYYLGIARSVAQRSNCLSAMVGAIIVREDQIVATGYSGAPRKVRDCMELGYCIRRKLGIPSGKGYEICRSVHAEMNAIINAARAGVSLLGGTMYLWGAKRTPRGESIPVDIFPCLLCKKMIINAGLERVVTGTSDGGYRAYNVADWVEEWRNKDNFLEDDTLYCNDYREWEEGS